MTGLEARKIGVASTVRWSAGRLRRSGVVLAVVGPWRDPDAVLRRLRDARRIRKHGDVRTHRSFIIGAPRRGGVYWPPVAALVAVFPRAPTASSAV